MIKQKYFFNYHTNFIYVNENFFSYHADLINLNLEMIICVATVCGLQTNGSSHPISLYHKQFICITLPICSHMPPKEIISPNNNILLAMHLVELSCSTSHPLILFRPFPQLLKSTFTFHQKSVKK